MYTSAIGMEMCCLYLGLALMRAHLGLGYLSLVLIIALYPLAFCFKLVIIRSPRTARRSLVLDAVSGIAIVSAVAALAFREVLAEQPEAIASAILQFGFCGLSWWLGHKLARPEIDYRNICVRFQIGILALLVLIAIERETFMPVVFFFILAMLSLSLARWESSASGSTGVLRAFRPWPVILGTLTVLLPSTLILLAVTPGFIRAILDWLSASWSNIAHTLGLDRPPTPHQPNRFDLSCSCRFTEPEMQLPTAPPPGTPPPISPIITWVIISITLCAMLFVVFITVKRIRVRRRASATEAPGIETETTSINLFRELVSAIKRMAGRLWQYLLSGLRAGYTSRFKPTPEHESVLSARALYRSLLRWAARQGLPRPQSQTPLEYLELLCQRFPQEEGELAVITDIYVQARYSHGPINSQVFEIARKAWQKIKLRPR